MFIVISYPNNKSLTTQGADKEVLLSKNSLSKFIRLRLERTTYVIALVSDTSNIFEVLTEDMTKGVFSSTDGSVSYYTGSASTSDNIENLVVLKCNYWSKRNLNSVMLSLLDVTPSSLPSKLEREYLAMWVERSRRKLKARLSSEHQKRKKALASLAI